MDRRSHDDGRDRDGTASAILDGEAVVLDEQGRSDYPALLRVLAVGFTSYDDILDHCCEAWNKLVEKPWIVMSIGLRKWAYRF